MRGYDSGSIVIPGLSYQGQYIAGMTCCIIICLLTLLIQENIRTNLSRLLKADSSVVNVKVLQRWSLLALGTHSFNKKTWLSCPLTSTHNVKCDSAVLLEKYMPEGKAKGLIDWSLCILLWRQRHTRRLIVSARSAPLPAMLWPCSFERTCCSGLGPIRLLSWPRGGWTLLICDLFCAKELVLDYWVWILKITVFHHGFGSLNLFPGRSIHTHIFPCSPLNPKQ